MWLFKRGKREKRKQKYKKKRRSKRVNHCRIDFRQYNIKNTLTSALLGSGIEMMWVLVLICCSGQFVFCPTLEENLALQVRDLLTGFHSEAWKHEILHMELETKQMCCSSAISKYQLFRTMLTYKVNYFTHKDQHLYNLESNALKCMNKSQFFIF